jgi:hypothetical protein
MIRKFSLHELFLVEGSSEKNIVFHTI